MKVSLWRLYSTGPIATQVDRGTNKDLVPEIGRDNNDDMPEQIARHKFPGCLVKVAKE